MTYDISIETYIQSVANDAKELHTKGQEVLSTRLPIINISPLSAKSYASSTRVKTIEGLLEKIKRKRTGIGPEGKEKKPDYQLADITDVIGIRFVTLYKHQISEILECLLMEIIGFDAYKGTTYEIEDFRNIFPASKIIEAKVYNSEPSNSTVSSWIETINGFTDLGLEKAEHSKYTSIHIIIYYQDIPIEFQIRTVFDDAWAQLNHSFQYSNEKNKSSPIEVTNQLLINSMLDNLKTFTDACADYADLIYKEAHDGVQNNNSIIHDVGDKQDVIKILRDHKISTQALAPLTAAFREMSKAFKIKRKNVEDFIKFQAEADFQFLKAAELLEKNNEKLARVQSDTAKNLYKYYALMNQALCYLSCSDIAHHRKAHDLYKAIIAQYEGYPMALYRYGQALEKLGHSASAYSRIQEALECAICLEKELKKEQSDKLLTRDSLHIRGWAPLKLGFINWYVADEKHSKDDTRENKKELLSQLLTAYDDAVDSIALAEQNLMSDIDQQEILRVANNNGLYYATDVLRLYESENKDFLDTGKDKKQWLSCIEKHTKFIDENIKIQDWDLNKHNSLGRGFYYLGEMEKANRHFDLILEQSLKPGKDLTARFKRELLFEHIVEANLYKEKISKTITKDIKE